jgi:hypothetical protein
MKYLGVILFLLNLTCIANAQDVSIATSANKNKVLVGDYISYNIEVQYPINATYIFWPNINEATIKPFSIIEASKIDTISNNNSIILKQKYTIACYDSGVQKLPALELGFQQNNSPERKFVVSDSQIIIVDNVPVNINGDIKDIIETQNDGQAYKKYIVALIIIAALIGLFFLIKYIRKNNWLGPKPKDAFKETQLLLQKANTQIGDSKLFYSTSTDAIKYYFSKRYNMQLNEKTSIEILNTFEKNDTLKNNITVIKQILNTADMAKFALQQIDATTNKNNLSQITEIINNAETQYQKALQDKLQQKK